MVFEADLLDGIRMRAFRDGMLAFELGSWGNRPHRRHFEREAEADYLIRCTRLMNVHLACLSAACRGLLPASAVTPDRLLSVAFEDGEIYSCIGGDPRWSTLRLESEVSTLHRVDWKHRMRTLVSVKSMQVSITLLLQLLTRERQEITLLRAEMLFRSAVAFRDFDYGAALVAAWTTIEGLLGDELVAYLADLDRDRTIDGDETFINSERRRFYEGSRVTSRHSAEILSLADRLPFSLYRDVLESAQARNKWLHNPTPEGGMVRKAYSAILTAMKLFELVEGVGLSIPLDRNLRQI